MAACDICGKPAVTQALVEGARLSVCAACIRYGTEINVPKVRKPGQQRPMAEYDVVGGYGSTVRKARERLGIGRQELARKIFAFENVLERVEEEKLKPDEKLARKLEKELGITLLEEKARESHSASVSSEPYQKGSRGLTLADIVEIRKK